MSIATYRPPFLLGNHGVSSVDARFGAFYLGGVGVIGCMQPQRTTLTAPPFKSMNEVAQYRTPLVQGVCSLSKSGPSQHCIEGLLPPI